MNRWGWVTCLVVVGCLLFGCSKEDKSDVGKKLQETGKQLQDAGQDAADAVEDTAEDLTE